MTDSGVLSREEILTCIRANPPLIQNIPDIKNQLQPNGFDLTIKEIAGLISPGTIGTDNADRILSSSSVVDFDNKSFLHLPAGSYLVTCNEIVNLPRTIMALARPRSSLLRCGVAIHTAVWDAGYSGRSQALMVVYNQQGFTISKDARFMQLVFYYLSRQVEEGYNGFFQNENKK
jgi:dUTP pyrophosphatase